MLSNFICQSLCVHVLVLLCMAMKVEGLGGGGGALTEIYLYLTYLTLNLIALRSEVFNYLCKIEYTLIKCLCRCVSGYRSRSVCSLTYMLDFINVRHFDNFILWNLQCNSDIICDR